MRTLIKQALQNQLKFRYIMADSWYSSAENIRFIDSKGKDFIFAIKSNRLAALSDEDRQQGHWQRIDELPIPRE